MATEVTVKLISLSLGKIQQSKQVKSGQNLRKSLLVASVLHKAKDIYMTEIKSRRADASSDCRPKRPKFSSQRSLIESDSHSYDNPTHHLPNSLPLSNYSHNDNVITGPLSATTEEDYEAETAAATAAISTTDRILDSLANEGMNKENSPPEEAHDDTNRSIVAHDSDDDAVTTTSKMESLSFKPCLKRRCSTPMDHLASVGITHGQHDDTDTDSDTSAKRARVHSIISSDESSAQRSNSLLHIFSSGSGIHTQSCGSDSVMYSDSASSTNNCIMSSVDNSTERSTFSLCRESMALTV